MTDDAPTLDATALARLAEHAERVGLAKLGIVRLDHPGFTVAADALDRYLDEGRHGEMEFLPRTRALRRDPSGMLAGAQSLLVVAVPYGGGPGAIARYARTADYHTVVHDRLELLEAELVQVVPGVATLICVDTKPILERSAAALAGLGFIGKHGCVIVPGLGSWVLLGGILCTARWTGPDAVDSLARVRWDACGSCTRCLDVCPTDAFDEPGRLDPRRCLSYLTIEYRGSIAEPFATALGERLAGCDACQEVCPYNASPERDERVPAAAWIGPPRFGPRHQDPWRLVEIGSATYRAWVKDTAVRRIPRRSMRRNALLAIGNRSAPLSTAEGERVTALVDDPDPHVAAAARRALERSRDR
jgi:epoxyqueuosine reductase